MAIGRTSGYRNTATLWRVYIPLQVDREQYIRNCYNTSTVTLINDNGEVYSNIPVGRTCIQYIEFPQDEFQLGSHVMCITEPRNNGLFVIEVFNSNDEYDFVNEHQQFIQQKTDSAYANVSVDGDKGSVSINAGGFEEDVGDISITSSNFGEDSSISIESSNVSVDGIKSVNIESEQSISLKVSDRGEDEKAGTISYILGEGFIYKDEFENSVTISEDSLTIIAQKVIMGGGSEPLLLGQKTVDFLGDLIDEISKSLVATSIGQQPLINSTAIAAFKSKLDELKSQLSFTD